jgi:hypothetical protein
VTGSSDYSGVYETQKVHTRLNLILALADSLDEKLTVAYGNSEMGVDSIVERWVIRREGDVVGEQIPIGGWQQERILQTAVLLGGVDFWFSFGEPPKSSLRVAGAIKPRFVR